VPFSARSLHVPMIHRCLLVLTAHILLLQEHGVISFEFDSGGPSRIEAWVSRRTFTIPQYLSLFLIACTHSHIMH